jgi:hypothetical protein
MIAQRVIYFFSDLLDIKATRAAAAWLRLNANGTVSERTAAQTLGDLGADARYPSITYAGPNPNYPQLTITGVVTAGVNGTLIYCGLINGKAAWSSDGTPVAGLGNPSNTRVSSSVGGDQWYVERSNTYAAYNLSYSATPVGLTEWGFAIGSGQPVITASATPTGTVIGQLCRSSSGLWRWDGSVWVEVTATASSIGTPAVLAALPSSAPLPIENGGTGGATPGAARINLEVGAVGDLLFRTATVAAARNVFGEVFRDTVADAPARNHNTLVDDPTLAGISLEANSVYRIEGFFIFSASATSGVRFRLVCSGALSPASSFYYGLFSIAGTLGQYSFTQTDGTGSTITRPNITSGLGFYISSILSTSDARTLALQWGQNTTDAAQTATRKGSSWLRVAKIS